MLESWWITFPQKVSSVLSSRQGLWSVRMQIYRGCRQKKCSNPRKRMKTIKHAFKRYFSNNPSWLKNPPVWLIFQRYLLYNIIRNLTFTLRSSAGRSQLMAFVWCYKGQHVLIQVLLTIDNWAVQPKQIFRVQATRLFNSAVSRTFAQRLRLCRFF